MSKNPIINSILAFAYIAGVVLVMNWGTKNISSQPDSLWAPFVLISLFTLSAAVMGYLFLLQPIVLFLDKKKKEAIKLLLQTIAFFGLITLIMMTLVFSGII